jgi:GGDEF domain-containing protein
LRLPRLVPHLSSERTALLDKAGREAETGRRLAMFDRETGLYAHWYLARRFEEEAQRSKRYSRPLSVVAIEVRGGDAYRVQDELRNWLDQGLRTTDLASHLGGGRYLALLTETVLEDASAIAARIAERFPEDVEIGLGCFPEDGSTLEDVQRAAERRAHGNWRLAV